MGLAGYSSADIYRDDFNRVDMDLRTSPHWGVAHGAYYGYRTSANRLVSVYAPMVGPEAIGADKFVGATYRGEEYQRVCQSRHSGKVFFSNVYGKSTDH